MPEEQLWGRNTANGQEIIYDICNRQPWHPPAFQSCRGSGWVPAATATGHGHLYPPPFYPTSPLSAGVAGPAIKLGVKRPSTSWVTPGSTGTEMIQESLPEQDKEKMVWGQSPQSDRGLSGLSQLRPLATFLWRHEKDQRFLSAVEGPFRTWM